MTIGVCGMSPQPSLRDLPPPVRRFPTLKRWAILMMSLRDGMHKQAIQGRRVRARGLQGVQAL
jgi:hypothetical protein